MKQKEKCKHKDSHAREPKGGSRVKADRDSKKAARQQEKLKQKQRRQEKLERKQLRLREIELVEQTARARQRAMDEQLELAEQAAGARQRAMDEQLELAEQATRARQRAIDEQLYKAALCGDLRGVRRALALGANPEGEQYGSNLLGRLCPSDGYWHNVAVIRELLEHGADFFSGSGFRTRTPLVIATESLRRFGALVPDERPPCRDLASQCARRREETGALLRTAGTKKEYLPLHAACLRPCSCPSACISNGYTWYGKKRACADCSQLERQYPVIVTNLIKFYPDALSVRTRGGDLPVMLAAATSGSSPPAPLDVIFTLLQGDPSVVPS